MGQIPIQHAFQSAVQDRDTNGIIKPSHWNAQHVITVPPQRLIGRDQVSAGPAEEIALLGADLEFNGSGVIQLKATGVNPGLYTNANIVVDAKGRVTQIAHGTTTGGATAASQYLLGTADATLPNARLPSDTSSIEWDMSIVGAFRARFTGTLEDDIDLNEHDITGEGDIDIDGDVGMTGDLLSEGGGYFKGGIIDVAPADPGVYFGKENLNNNRAIQIVTGHTAAYIDFSSAGEDNSSRILSDVVNDILYLQSAGGVVSSNDFSVPDLAYDASSWNGSLLVPTRNAVRDKLELILANYASTANGLGAALIGVQDGADYFTGTTLEAILAEIGAYMVAYNTAIVLKGTWAANGGSFPGAGSAQAGWTYIVSSGGTVDGQTFTVGDRITAIVDNASTSTFAANWFKEDYTDLVSSVDGMTGAVSLSSTYQPLDSDLTAIAALSTNAYGRGLLEYASEATFKAGVNLEIGVDVQAYDADTLKADVTDDLDVGFTSASKDQGTKSSGTFTPAFATGNVQHYTNGGAHTLAPPSSGHGSIVIDVTNNGSAGAITTSGFTKVTGDSFTTTNGHKFRCFITVGNGGSHLHKQALQ